MTVVDLITQLQQRHIQIWAEDGKLRTRAPTGALTTDLREAIAQQREEVFAFLDRAKVSKAIDTRPAIEPIARNGHLQLSFAQQRLWFLARLTPDSAAYHNQHRLKWSKTRCPFRSFYRKAMWSSVSWICES